MTSRQPRDTEKTRIHVLVETKRLKVIDRAAKKMRMARSNYVASAAFEIAEDDLDQLAKKEIAAK